MRGITEERLIELMHSSLNKRDVNFIYQLISAECKELIQQEVSELLPISECNVGWLVKRKDSDVFDMCTAICSHDSIVTSDTDRMCVLISGYEGCLPPPVYRK